MKNCRLCAPQAMHEGNSGAKTYSRCSRTSAINALGALAPNHRTPANGTRFGSESVLQTRGRPLRHTPEDLRHAPRSYRLRPALGRASAAFKSCLNKSISNGLSIRGLFEVASI